MTVLVVLFVVTYAAIVLEHPLGVHKSASALLGSGLLWATWAVLNGDPTGTEEALSHTLVGTAQIVFFLMGAMTIVEVIDAHAGFDVITSRVGTRRLTTLLWIVGIVTFFLSAVLDNLTTTIVMVSLVRRLLAPREDRLLFAGIVVIAANAGGAWTPIGDVTTTMLWIGGQVTTLAIMKGVFLPSVVNALVPLVITSFALRGRPVVSPEGAGGTRADTTPLERNLMFGLGLGTLVAVPAFKTVTHLPPFMGVLLGLGLLWVVGELLHRKKADDERSPLSLTTALTRIDLPSIVFFIGILLAVAVLEHTGVLATLAGALDRAVGRQDVIVGLIGLVSAVVDNVPLVAAAMGMYDLATHPPDSFLWEFLAYCAGTGGSLLIVGSAAGVAAMGIERIEFLWYVRRITPMAVLGYLAGAAVYLLGN